MKSHYALFSTLAILEVLLASSNADLQVISGQYPNPGNDHAATNKLVVNNNTPLESLSDSQQNIINDAIKMAESLHVDEGTSSVTAQLPSAVTYVITEQDTADPKKPKKNIPKGDVSKTYNPKSTVIDELVCAVNAERRKLGKAPLLISE
jgi:hypothetical protein